MARKPRLNPALTTLTNAPDVQERRNHYGVEEINPDQISVDDRLVDRLHLDIEGLKAAIKKDKQRVPILVRPIGHNKYQLIYGRRRLEACRELGLHVRAIVARLDDDQVVREQISENAERQDLSFIERSLLAKTLLDDETLPVENRTQRAVGEILNMSEAGVSQLLRPLKEIELGLVHSIGPAPGIGRPRWEILATSLKGNSTSQRDLSGLAASVRSDFSGSVADASDAAFDAVFERASRRSFSKTGPTENVSVKIDGIGVSTFKKLKKGTSFRLDLDSTDPGFVEWMEKQSDEIVKELHDRWKRSED